MRPRILISISAITLLPALAVPPRVSAQDNWDGKHAKFILFDAPDAGTVAGQPSAQISLSPPCIGTEELARR
jgi:hypothetical protein